MSYDAPYAGLKVVDLSQGIAGPYCAMLLAQHGADVVKVEPLAGDWSRTLSRRFGEQTAFSIGGNLGKRSLAVDLKEADGTAIVRQLAAEADVFIEGFRPGVIGRLGFGYEALKARNPRLLYLSVSGFGQSGPFADRPALDPILQAFTGMMVDNQMPDGLPHRVGGLMIDMATGLYAFQALAPAIYARRDATEGRYLETSLMQTGAAIQAVSMLKQYLEHWQSPPGRAPNGIFRTKDGWLMLIVLGEKEFPPFCAALDRPDLATDPRFVDNTARLANREALVETLNRILPQRTTAEWGERLTKAGTLHEAVNDFAAYLAHPHVTASGMVSWLEHPSFERPLPIPLLAGIAPFQTGTPRGTAPTLGQHTAEILAALGYSEARIAELERRQVVRLSRA